MRASDTSCRQVMIHYFGGRLPPTYPPTYPPTCPPPYPPTHPYPYPYTPTPASPPSHDWACLRPLCSAPPRPDHDDRDQRWRGGRAQPGVSMGIMARERGGYGGSGGGGRFGGEASDRERRRHRGQSRRGDLDVEEFDREYGRGR